MRNSCGLVRAVVSALGFLAFGCARVAMAADAAESDSEDLTQLSLEALGNLQVTSVSKVNVPLRQAPAAIYVITHEEIVRSGATKLSEVLRWAPNLRLTQFSASRTTLTARGFGGQQADQAFPNKLLILIDGRSVYSPLFSGIYLDAQDLVLEDIDRIEVISGPGATLWGANAVNGVINIITRPAYLTTGKLVSLGAGNQEQTASARYGGWLNGDTAYRVYAKSFHDEPQSLADGTSAHDGWWRSQGGARIDWSRGGDTVTAQGDVYRGTENQLAQQDQLIAGANILARWQHQTEHSQLQLQAYYDQTERLGPAGGGSFVLHTYDVELQQQITPNGAHEIVWGAGERLNSYGITNTSTLLFLPEQRALTLSNLFAQDTISVARNLKLTLGLKAEDDPYSGWSPLPDVRLAFQLSERELLWASASRAIRSPTPFDVDVVEKLGGQVFLTGNGDFRPERVSTYQVGYRGQPGAALAWSISGFYNFYDDLRSVEPASNGAFLPLHWGNEMQGHTYAVEAWADWQVALNWRLSPNLTLLHENLRFSAGASGLLGLSQAGDDPHSQAGLKSSLDLPHRLTFDAYLRYVSSLPDPALKAYTELNVRLGWRLNDHLELALTGSNLLYAHHYEYPAPDGEQISRAGMLQARWSE